ncbi:MAG: hypothetical protein AAF485_11040 [Chloroflexota bacterium]
MAEKQTSTQSFLIRILGSTDSPKRIMLVRVSQQQERHYFISFDDLMIFLLQEFDQRQEGGAVE